MSKMKNASDRINSRLDTAEKKISEFEDIVIEIIQNKLQREIRDTGGKEKASMSCGMTIHIIPQKRRGEEQRKILKT